MTDLSDVGLSRLPRPIAWALSEPARQRDAAARLQQFLVACEQTARYLALVALARYLELRPEGG